MKVYLDNVIVSGLELRDLSPPEEMAAVDAIIKTAKSEQIEVFTSRWTHAEQDRTQDPVRRVRFKESREKIEVVTDDHRILGFSNLTDPWGATVSANPNVSDIPDERLFSDLVAKAGISRDDAKHLMYAVHNGCVRFVTLDTRDILPKRAAAEALCRGMKIVKPSELAVELSVSD